MIHRPPPDTPLFAETYRAKFPAPAVIRAALADMGLTASGTHPADGKARADHGPTSKAAARSIAPNSKTLRVAVFQAILSRGGLTDEEGIGHTGISPSTYRPRRVELVEAGVVRDSGRTRATVSGRAAVVWEAYP